MESNNNYDNEKKESKKTKIFSTIYSGIVIVGYIMVICLGFALCGFTIAFCFTYWYMLLG